jgi:nucleoside-diphosphate-sugar epimerase
MFRVRAARRKRLADAANRARLPARRREAGVRVLVTGATGFIGWHAAARLAAGGHAVRALVRDPDKGRRVLAPIGVSAVDLVAGDMTDPAAVARALAGCDAALHAAAAVSVTRPGARDAFDANVTGTSLVVGGACDRGLRSVVFVSSLTAIFDPRRPITADSPLVRAESRYGRSKVESDRFARERAAAGCPVSIVYPPGVVGPDDPGMSESVRAYRGFLRGTLKSSGGNQFVDARDLAVLLVRLLERGGGGRVVAAGHFFDWDAFTALFETVSGASIRPHTAPGWALRAAGRAADVVSRVRGRSFPISGEGMGIATRWTRIPDSPEVAALGVRWRPPEQTIEDMLRWFLATGRIPPRAAPRLAGAVPPA